MLDRCDVITIGETMALLRTDEAHVSPGTRYTLGFGGAESNVAVGLSRLGVSVAWYSALGDDDFGAMIRDGLVAEGVEVVAREDTQLHTGLMVKSLSTGHSRSVTYYRGASAARTLNVSDLERVVWEGVSLIHLTGILPAISDGARDLWVAAARAAKERGVVVSLDVNFRPSLWSSTDASRALDEIIADVDVVFGDTGELSLLTQRALTETEMARAVRDRGPSEIVIKRGERGAASLVEDGWSELPAYPVNVLDSVGAGDAFVAGYLSATLEGLAPEPRLSRAVLSGALACTHPGDWEGAPFRRDLESSMMGVAP